MVKIAAENARVEGIGRFEARTGFGEHPLFPRGAERPFDLVISSGVVSFAPDVGAFLAGVTSTLRNSSARLLSTRRATRRFSKTRT